MILLSSQHWADKKNTYRLTAHAETLIHKFVSSWLITVTAVLYGLLQVQIGKIQRVRTQLQDLFLSNLSFAI